jgi:hypothetical protein
MEYDLSTLLVSLQSNGLGMGRKGQDGEGQGEIPAKKFLRNFVFFSEVVDHNGNLGAKSRFQSGWYRGDKGKLMSDSIQNLDFQMKGF